MHAETRETVYIKDLKKAKRIGQDISRILFVDDTPSKLTRNYGNAIYMRPYFGNDHDAELHILLNYLESICNEPDFRKIEKRGWRRIAE